MWRVRLLVLLIAVVIVAVIAAIAVLPGVTDWNRYRGTLEALAGEALGRPVVIAGPVSLSVLPEPVLTASKVSVGGGGGARITIRELRLGVALLPLLAGRVDARTLTLQRPDFHLPWPPWRSVVLTAPPWPAELSARIQDGRIESGAIVLTNVDATLVAGQGDTVLTLIGSAVENGNPWNLSLRLGEPQIDGTEPLDVTLQGGGHAAGTAARISGRLSPGGDLAGHIALDGPKLSELITAPALPFHADSSFTFGSEPSVRLTGLTVTLASVSAHGTGRLVLKPDPRLDLALASTDAIPLDPWLGVLRQGGVSRLPIGLSLTAPRATLARGLLQHLNLAIVLGKTGTEIGAFRAILPGNASFAAEGRIIQTAGARVGWQFEGTTHLDAPSMLDLVHWLNDAAPGVLPPLPVGVLGEATIGGRVVIGANAIAFTNLVGTIDHSNVTGSLSLGLAGQPAISAGLQLDRLDLDPWLPVKLRQIPPHRFFDLAEVPALFSGMSVELRLTARAAVLGRTGLTDLSLDAAAEPGQIIVRRLDATVDGVHAIASGTIGKNGNITEGRLALTATGPAPLVRHLPVPFKAAIGHWKAGFSLNATATGPPQGLKLAIEANLGDLRLTANPVVNLDQGTWHGPLSIRHPGAAELITASGLPNPVTWLGQGSLALIAEAAGSPRSWSLQQSRLIAGALHADGLLKNLQGTPITGDVHATILPIPIPGSAAVNLLTDLASAGKATIVLTADKVMAGQRVVLEDAAGSLQITGSGATLEVNGKMPGGGALAAALTIATGTGPPRFHLGAAFSGVQLKGGLTKGFPDIDSGTMRGTAALSAQGYAPAALLATLSGTVKLTLHDGILSGLDVPGVRSALSGGETAEQVAAGLGKALAHGRSRFSHLELVLSGNAGRFTLQRARMTGDGGIVEADGTIDLPAESEALRLTIHPELAGSPDLLLRLGGPMIDPKRVEEFDTALQWAARASHQPH